MALATYNAELLFIWIPLMPPVNKYSYPARDEVTLPIDGRIAICRCWQSKKFPYCDGEHRCFNEETREGLGPMIVKGPDYKKPEK